MLSCAPIIIAAVKFRVLTLRNIAVTAPYMHDGSLTTLEEVLGHDAAGGKMDHPNKTKIMRTRETFDSNA